MPLESATYINQLVETNPAGTDDTDQGDDHLRLIKAALLNTFPGFTAAALNSTQAEIDSAATAVNTNGVTVLADAGVNFKTHTTDGLRNPASGEVDIEVGGVAGLKVTASTVTAPADMAVDGNETVTGNLTVTGEITGPGSVPIGGTVIWWDDTLPTDPGWTWANGGEISRTSNPILWARWGTKYGSGNGTTTFNVPDLQEAAPVGKSTMGGASSPGRITNYVLTVLGSFIGACLHTLVSNEIPAHTHTADSTVNENPHSHGINYGGGGIAGQGSSQFDGAGGASGGTTAPATTGLTVSTTVHANTGGDGAHDNVSPGMVCNFIIRIG